eukprot:6712184-Pyramimonas_sp.AAC.1
MKPPMSQPTYGMPDSAQFNIMPDRQACPKTNGSRQDVNLCLFLSIGLDIDTRGDPASRLDGCA